MTDTAKHTPGPWFDWDAGVWNYEPAKLLTNLADARLIAAASELLEAMIGIEHFSDALNFRSDPLLVALRQWIDAGRNAIAKAEGRAA